MIFGYAEKDKRISILKEKNIIVIKVKLFSQKKGFDEARIELPQTKLENEDLFIRFFDKVNELNPFIKEMEKMKQELETTKNNNYEKYDNEMKKINETLTNLQNLVNQNNENLKKKDEEIKNESDKKIADVNNIINELKKKDEEQQNLINDLKKKIEELEKKIPQPATNPNPPA